MAKKKAKKFSSFLENPIDYTLLITVLLLLTIGLIMVLSASSPTSISESGKVINTLQNKQYLQDLE